MKVLILTDQDFFFHTNHYFSIRSFTLNAILHLSPFEKGVAKPGDWKRYFIKHFAINPPSATRPPPSPRRTGLLHEVRFFNHWNSALYNTILHFQSTPSPVSLWKGGGEAGGLKALFY